MFEPNIITIIASVEDGKIEPLSRHLAETINPDDNGDDRKFPFKSLPNLHFCSFTVIEGVPGEDLPAYLVFEATFDGPSEAFLWDLVETGRQQLCDVLSHCAGFASHPDPSNRVIRDYLANRVVLANAYFTGFPGRSVARIRFEERLRLFLRKVRQDVPLPTEHQEILRKLRKAAIADPDFACAAEIPPDAWAVRWGRRIFQGLTLVAGLTTLVVGWGLAGLFGWPFAVVASELVGALFETGFERALLAALGTAVALRLAEAVLRRAEQAGPPSLIGTALGDIVFVARAAAQGLTILLAVSLAIGFALPTEDAKLRMAWPSEAVSLVGLALALPVWVLTRYFKGSAQRMTFEQDKNAWPVHQASAWIFSLDLVWLIARLALLIPAYWLAGLVLPAWVFEVLDIALFLLIPLLAFAAVGGVVIALLKMAFMILLTREEARDRSAYLPASLLTTRQSGRSDIWAREEHGDNAVQNHFASVTLVKPGILRLTILRVGLAFIHLAAQYRNFSGTLGGIPTIMSARWILLDRGRRLLFLTNYVGSWDSYLNEFSELDAVDGVNAIWSNTYTRLQPDQLARYEVNRAEVNFPTTCHLLHQGARHVPVFKAYVRQSQIRSLAWYGAYRHLSVPAINDNSRIRKAIFGRPSLAECDAVLRKL